VPPLYAGKEKARQAGSSYGGSAHASYASSGKTLLGAKLMLGRPASAAAVSSEAAAPDWLTRHQRWVPYGLFVLAVFLRFYRLDQPSGVVFGEFGSHCAVS
jgi:hypothetical protein